MKILLRIFVLAALACIFASGVANAQSRHQDSFSQELHKSFNVTPPPQVQGARTPESFNPGVNYIPPPEPVFKKVKYLKIEPPRSLNERIESLIHAIYIDVPPEYDHYGYEIRRYMVGVLGPKVLGSQTNIDGQIKNIKNALIILRYWREENMKQVAAIEKDIENSNASSSARRLFKYNRGVADAFFVEAGSWMRNNLAVLEYLKEIGPKAYAFEEPKLTFKDRNQFEKFIALVDAKHKALEQLQDYTPFRMMVY